MTREQIRICKIIRKYGKLTTVIKKTRVEDYLDLQYRLPGYHLEFSDSEMDENTVVSLDDFLTEELENHIEGARAAVFDRVLAIYAAIVSTAAIGVEIWLHFLQE